MNVDNPVTIIKATTDKVKNFLSKEDFRGTGHDWWHTYRVWKMALHIAKAEKPRELSQQKNHFFIIEMSALLHDVDDWKFCANNSEIHQPIARDMLSQFQIDNETTEAIFQIIENISFKGGHNANNDLSFAGQIVQDADRLDAIGAIGIARTFSYGGYKNREIYDPNTKPQSHKSFSEYKNANGTTINHFYEKLLLLESRMNTKTAQNIAKQRHKYMEEFLKQFFTEWDFL